MADLLNIAHCIDNQQSAFSNQQLKRGPRWPPFFHGRGRLLPFLAGLLFPALGFLRHFLLSPPSCGITARALTSIARGCRLARSPDVRRSSRRGTFRELGRV